MMKNISVLLLLSLLFWLCFPVSGMAQNASVGGFVWDDLNSNGLQDTLEPGIAGVVVVLENGDSTVANQATDSTGHYLFSGLTADSFRLEFVNPGGLFFTLQNVGTNDSIDSDTDNNGFVGFFALADSQALDFDAGFSATPLFCAISALVDSVLCSDNNTPADTTDDTFTFLLSVAGGIGTWHVPPDTTLFAYDSAFVFGPFPISGGPLTLIVVDSGDSTCTDTVMIVPPPPCSTVDTCATPVTATVGAVACDNNGTPNDASDDTFTFELTVAGGTGTWSALPDTIEFPYDSTFTFGPFPISGGPVSRVVTDNADALCSDSVTVDPPAVCSCLTPISATFSDVVCNDNGTGNDSTDDVFTFKLTATGGTGTWKALPDTAAIPFDSAATFGPFPISGGPLTFVVQSNSDTFCVDSVVVTPPAPCSVPVIACDVKEIGCIRFELLGITLDSAKRRTYQMQVTNNCDNKLIYAAFQLPKGIKAKAPDDGSVYTAPSGREYEVRNPNFSPYYSIRFKTTTDSISSGQSDIFEYTLPAQAQPTYILATVRVWPKIFYQAHLNTFDCDDAQPKFLKATPSKLQAQVTTPPGVTPGPGKDPGNPVSATPQMQVYPNPTTGGAVSVHLSDWAGQTVEIQLFDGYGKMILTKTTVADDVPFELELPAGLDAGIYWVRMIPPTGKPQLQQLVLQW